MMKNSAPLKFPVVASSARRASVLREMGLGPRWRLRAEFVASTAAPAPALAPAADVSAAPPARSVETAILDIPHLDTPHLALAPVVPSNASVPTTAAVPDLDDLLYEAANERQAQREQSYDAAPAPARLETAEQAELQRRAAIAAMTWDELKASVASCRACALCKERKQAVLGEGDVTADWLCVGEGPGAEEDESGRPFIGQAGQLLDAMLAAIGLKRGEKVYLTNAVKCRPAAHHPPNQEEIAACRPYLERQIALLQPKLMLALGRPAAQTLLQTEIKIATIRGQIQQYSTELDATGIPVVVTYHPAYLLRTPSDKAKVWEDLCLARRTYRRQNPEMG